MGSSNATSGTVGTTKNQMIRISGCCQNYAWGKVGRNSEVARLLALGCGADIDPSQPYAELWMGTHPKGPATIGSSNENSQSLSSFLAQNKSALGKNLSSVMSDKDGHVQLPFLFKVLSVNQALSVQVHPTKDEARVLHRTDPKNYPDDNHKPEMAIALTDFELMCGFRPFQKIVDHIEGLGTLRKLLSLTSTESLRNLTPGSDEEKCQLKALFSTLMKSDESKMHEALDSLIKELNSLYGSKLRATSLPLASVDPSTRTLIMRLRKEYPGDIGCFAPLFLNYFTLSPFEATFLGPNEPHAYLSGDCIECMACSDNTIRAGLTPKFVDVENLCKMLTYRCSGPEANKFPSKPCPGNDHINVYEPPVPDFAVRCIQGALNSETYRIPSLGTCSIMLVQSGAAECPGAEGDQLSAGNIFLVPADFTTTFTVSNTPLVLFQAYCVDAKVNELL